MLTRSLLPSRQDRPWGSRLSPASRGWWGGGHGLGTPNSGGHEGRRGQSMEGKTPAWRGGSPQKAA